ncbi:PTS sugar transporter subunit IIB [Lacticaseibacillus pantheris]|uniref:PTS sugar transporter subunit IIB n=1 Tax=Lacticaseibacillus pantheris TaxID=171523 RepID=UPI00265A56DA|nr:PTS sugar transporter subunit IIB [Lacticaseibacillus pantheris]WKF84167.1 PTS sugar transporter subunit IIB [Lacticaseibacillus pantheris]
MAKVLLVCGSGASSGFMAAAGRKAAKKANADLEFKARSDSELGDFLQGVDLLLIAPHLKYMLHDAQEEANQYEVKVAIIPQKVYGALDGKGLVAFASDELAGK